MKKNKDFRVLVIKVAVLVAILAVILYPLVRSASLLAINPSKIQQAGGARFYENFIYDEAGHIPRGCIVFTYDPPLFNLNGLSAAQMSYTLEPQEYKNITAGYSCVVIDYGYWCSTPNNICNASLDQFTTEDISEATYQGFTYKLYEVTGFSSSSTLSR